MPKEMTSREKLFFLSSITDFSNTQMVRYKKWLMFMPPGLVDPQRWRADILSASKQSENHLLML